MTTHTSGATDLPDALRPIHRFEVVDCIDSKHVPAVIPNPQGPWVRYEDHVAALAAGQAVAPADGWLQEGGLLYRLTDERRPCNRDEIRVTMAGGSRSTESCSRRASELLDRIRLTPPAMDGGDTAMLDWLDADANEHVFHIGKTWYTRPSYGQPYRKRPNLRDAIRAAWAAQKEGE